jgi:hypothetical protein
VSIASRTPPLPCVAQWRTPSLTAYTATSQTPWSRAANCIVAQPARDIAPIFKQEVGRGGVVLRAAGSTCRVVSFPQPRASASSTRGCCRHPAAATQGPSHSSYTRAGSSSLSSGRTEFLDVSHTCCTLSSLRAFNVPPRGRQAEPARLRLWESSLRAYCTCAFAAGEICCSWV